jgi:hypothetical protein
VYLEFHKGRGDKKAFKDDRKRSIFYRERIRGHKVQLGENNDPDLY